MPLFDKEIEGFAVIWHLCQLSECRTFDPAIARLRGPCVQHLYLLPAGSNGACKDGWDKIIRWQLDSRHAPCNMVELMPRLSET